MGVVCSGEVAVGVAECVCGLHGSEHCVGLGHGGVGEGWCVEEGVPVGFAVEVFAEEVVVAVVDGLPGVDESLFCCGLGGLFLA